MNKRLQFSFLKIFLVAAGVLVVLFVFESNYNNAVTFTSHMQNDDLDHSALTKNINSHHYLVSTSFCKIPFIEPFDSSIVGLLQPGTQYKCNRHSALTYTNATHIIIDSNGIGDEIDYCVYQAILRPKYVADHNYYKYGNPSEKFTYSIRVREDFVKVRCYNRDSKYIYTNFHHFVQPNYIRDRAKRKMFRKHLSMSDDKKLSVLMLGVDSVSRLNFMRYMQRTRSFILEDLEGIDFMGYNKVADNTFVNIVPMTMGQYLEDIPWNETMNNIPFDSYNFIWKQYADKGYTTLYAEDKPKIAIFDFLKAGFHRAPSDYFNRHYTIAMDSEVSLWYKNGKCFGNKLETDMVLDYLKDFIIRYHNSPFFSFAFITGLTHDLLENAAAADPSYLRFFRELSNNGSLNNTIVVFFSDHGMRFGSFRNTFVGRLEERLPFMFMLVPPWFKQQYPGVYTNLLTNAQRLTTPFDVYEMLEDVLYFDVTKVLNRNFSHKKRGFSLFSKIPENRTCDDASILAHWCTCANREVVPSSSPVIVRVAVYIVQSINSLLDAYSNICAQLNVQNVEVAEKLVLSDNVLKFKESKNDVINRKVTYGEKSKAYVDYTVILKTSPGGAIFEATVQHNEMRDSFQLKGDISRINKYGDQSICIPNHSLKKYCFCNI